MSGEYSQLRQGGSIAPFILIGVVLVALAIAGVSFLQQRSTDTASNSTTPSTTPSSSVSPASSTPSTSPTMTASPQATTQATPKASSAPVQPSNTPQKPNTTTPQQGSSNGSFAQGSQIPVTGPENIMPLGLIAAFIVGLAAYIIEPRVSRR